VQQDASLRGPKERAASLAAARQRRDPYARANRGVRDRQDADRARAARDDPPDDALRLSALERKAALYDRMRGGEVFDGDGAEGSARFHVDFLGKHAAGHAGGPPGPAAGVTEEDWRRQVSRAGGDRSAGLGAEASYGGAGERERARAAGERAAEERESRVAAVREVEEETREGQRRAREARERAADERARRRELLKRKLVARLLDKERAKMAAGGGAAPGVVVDLTRRDGGAPGDEGADRGRGRPPGG